MLTGEFALDLRRREEEILKYWKEYKVDEEVRKKNVGKKKFYFLDGPPYAYTELASHHMWVTTIKDDVLRYKRYRGFGVHDRPGFDVHGLPTENKVERNLGITSKDDIEKRIGVEKFVAACRELVDSGIKEDTKTLRRLGASFDFEHVYLPYKNEYMSKGWEIFKKIYEKGLVYKGLQPLAYCPHCETVLSSGGMELEYSDDKDVAIFVTFNVLKSKKDKIDFGDNTCLVVWTTTPWTLPANIAIAANPKEKYVIARIEGRGYVVAKERLDAFAGIMNANMIIEKEFYGSELEGVGYLSPLEAKVPMQKEFRKYHRVILSELFVTVLEGSGLLHVAPGHGVEDAKLGKQYRLPFFSPVDAHAKYTSEAGSYAGLKVPEEANPKVLEDLNSMGVILNQAEVVHSYPHCWRCGTKLIYRATDQWFVNVQKIKKRMLSENQKINWYPEAARGWFAEAIESSPDWTISRQRYWGNPIPVWVCSKCGEIEVIGSIRELVERAGLKSEPADIHKPYIDKITLSCKKCSGSMRRVPDILDVWYDAGIAHTASLSEEEFSELFPADWITESNEQIRGWFATLLRTSVAAYGKRSFEGVSIGGMMKDQFGEEMHRHLGNAVSALDIFDVSSADGFRLWCSSHPRWLELKLKRQEMVEADRDIVTLYNTMELVRELAAAANIDLYKIKKPRAAKLAEEDAWMVSRLNSLIDSCTKNLDSYLLDVAVNNIRNFIVEDFSRFYLRLVKKRVAGGSRKEQKQLANLAAYVLKKTIVLASIVIPFSTDYIYQQLFSKNKESIFMSDWPKPDKKAISKQLEEEFGVARDAITALLNSREKAGIKLRWPIARAAVEVKDDSSESALERLSGLIEDYTNIKKVNVKRVESFGKEVMPLFAKIGPDFKEKAEAVAEALKKEDADKLESAIASDGHYPLRTEKGLADVTAEHFAIVQKLESENAIIFKQGIASVDREMSKELFEEGMVREFERRVQMARKEKQLKKTDRIRLFYQASAQLAEIVKKNAGKIKRDVGAKELHDKLSEESKAEEFEIEEEKLRIEIEKLV